MSYLAHEHTSNECAISIVSVWRRPVASITYKNPIEITDGNCKRPPIISSNLLSMVWATVSRWESQRQLTFAVGNWPQIHTNISAISRDSAPIHRNFDIVRDIWSWQLFYLLIRWTVKLPPTAYISPPTTVTSLACEKSDTLSFMNDHHLTRTTSFVPLMVVRLVNGLFGWTDAVRKARRGVRLCDCRISASSRQDNHWSRRWPGQGREVRTIMSSDTILWPHFLLVDRGS